MEPTLPNFGNERSVGSAGFFCEGPDINYFGLRGPALSVAAALPDSTEAAGDSTSANKAATFMSTETGNS